MIFFVNFSDSGQNWFLGPLLMFALPALLNGGIPQLVAGVVHVVTSIAGDGWLAVLLTLLVAAGMAAATVYMWRQMASTRIGQTIRQLLFTGMQGGTTAAAGAQHPGQQQQQQARTTEQRQQRWDQVVSVLQKLPMDTVMTRAGLEQLTPHELKQRLSQQHISCTGCVEKQELVEKLLEAGGSSGASCSICCEDYAGGDVVRVLPCKHRYHVECIDRWLLSSSDCSRLPACPLCNASLLPPGA